MTYSAGVQDTLPVPAEPAVLSVHILGPDTGTKDIPIYVPWKNCTLAYAYTVTTVTEGNVNNVGIDLELNAASGSAIGTITVAKNAAVGDLDEIGTITRANARDLNRENTSRDAVNIEITSAGTTAWQGTLFMYFERDVGY